MLTFNPITRKQRQFRRRRSGRRDSAVAINAKICRTKARLLEEVPKLQRLAVKKVEGLFTEEHAVWNNFVVVLPDIIQAIPDGTAAAPKPSEGWGTSASRTEIKFDSGGCFDYEILSAN